MDLVLPDKELTHTPYVKCLHYRLVGGNSANYSKLQNIPIPELAPFVLVVLQIHLRIQL